MRRFAWLVAMGVLLAACASPTAGPQTAGTSTVTSGPAATSQPLPTGDAAGPVAPTSTPQEITREQVVQIQPDDWVTIIEWGDFQ